MLVKGQAFTYHHLSIWSVRVCVLLFPYSHVRISPEKELSSLRLSDWSGLGSTTYKIQEKCTQGHHCKERYPSSRARKEVTSTLNSHIKTLPLTPHLHPLTSPRQNTSCSVQSILMNSQSQASLNFHASHSLCPSQGDWGSNIWQAALIMRMIFHDLLWLMSLSIEWHIRSHLGHMFLYRESCSDSQLPVFIIPSCVMEICTDRVPCALFGISFLWGWLWRK